MAGNRTFWEWMFPMFSCAVVLVPSFDIFISNLYEIKYLIRDFMWMWKHERVLWLKWRVLRHEIHQLWNWILQEWPEEKSLWQEVKWKAVSGRSGRSFSNSRVCQGDWQGYEVPCLLQGIPGWTALSIRTESMRRKGSVFVFALNHCIKWLEGTKNVMTCLGYRRASSKARVQQPSPKSF